MNRGVSALQLDIRLQRRYGFYYAAAFITLVWIVVLRSLPQSIIEQALAFIIFTDLGVVGFYFVAGQIIFEKGERTIYAIITTPLRFSEYLFGKIVSLSLLALVISFVVLGVTYGFSMNILLFLLGVVLMSVMVLLVGVIGVAPYSSISTFILPSQLYFLVMNVPLLSFFGIFNSPLLYLIPTQGSVILLKGAFIPIENWQLVYAVLYQLLWIVFLKYWAEKRFQNYIVAQRGGSVK